jgi:hypothetical protein
MKKKTPFEKFLDNPDAKWCNYKDSIKNTSPLFELIENPELEELSWYEENPDCTMDEDLTFIDVFPCGTAVTYTYTRK